MMVLTMKVIMLKVKNMDLAFMFTIMVQNILANGKKIKKMAKGNIFLPMEIYTMDIGRMEKEMVQAYCYILMVISMKVTGKMIKSMV